MNVIVNWYPAPCWAKQDAELDGVGGTKETSTAGIKSIFKTIILYKKIDIKYLGRIIKRSQLFVLLIVIIFWCLHLSIYKVHDFRIATELS